AILCQSTMGQSKMGHSNTGQSGGEQSRSRLGQAGRNPVAGTSNGVPALQFPPDAVEHELADVARARALIGAERPDVLEMLALRRERLLSGFGLALADELGRCEDALVLGLARFGRRHGSWGLDYHHYHNENHALEILDSRIGRMMDAAGLDALPGPDWLALSLFSCCHDLRQRED